MTSSFRKQNLNRVVLEESNSNKQMKHKNLQEKVAALKNWRKSARVIFVILVHPVCLV